MTMLSKTLELVTTRLEAKLAKEAIRMSNENGKWKKVCSAGSILGLKHFIAQELISSATNVNKTFVYIVTVKTFL